MIKDTNLIDYAYPMMMAERAMKSAHAAMLSQDFDAANEHMLNVAAEVKLTMNSIKHMKEQHDALRK
jgi:hypothetical protein